MLGDAETLGVALPLPLPLRKADCDAVLLTAALGVAASVGSGDAVAFAVAAASSVGGTERDATRLTVLAPVAEPLGDRVRVGGLLALPRDDADASNEDDKVRAPLADARGEIVGEADATPERLGLGDAVPPVLAHAEGDVAPLGAGEEDCDRSVETDAGALASVLADGVELEKNVSVCCGVTKLVAESVPLSVGT